MRPFVSAAAIEQAIAAYVLVLERSLACGIPDNERRSYETRLSSAAILLSEFIATRSVQNLRESLLAEKSRVAWYPISGEFGSEAEKALENCLALVDQ